MKVVNIIEKHITLDKNMEGPDHSSSLECKDLKKFVSDIRELEIMLIGLTIAFNSVTTASLKLKGVESYIDKWREEILQSNIRGINAMSISEITGIPRPTAIRKIKSLIKFNMVDMDKNKLLHIKFNKKTFKETSKLQNDTINDLSELVSRTINQISIN